MKRIRIWTDGCCLVNPGGPGGWAIVVERGGQVIAERSGGEAQTTNNRMELMALVEALTYAGGGRVEVVSDSKYVVDGTMTWMANWKQRGWRRRGRGKSTAPIKNVDLWQEIDRLFTGTLVTITWIKAHANHAFNERADELAGLAARQVEPPAESPEEFVQRVFG